MAGKNSRRSGAKTGAPLHFRYESGSSGSIYDRQPPLSYLPNRTDQLDGTSLWKQAL